MNSNKDKVNKKKAKMIVKNYRSSFMVPFTLLSSR